MVMKINGKELPISPMKLQLHDSFFDLMKTLRQIYGLKNNVEVIQYALNHLAEETAAKIEQGKKEDEKRAEQKPD